MLFKLSSISSILFVTVGVLAIWAQNQEHLEIKDKILKPIESILHAKETDESNTKVPDAKEGDGIVHDTQEHGDITHDEKEHVSVVHDSKEHGNFDSKSRDVMRETSKKLKEIRDKIRLRIRNLVRHSDGLDLDDSLHDGKLENFKSNVQAIYPGTKWCGDGNISSSFDDLGKFSKTDSCCREHDSCPDYMDADSAKHGLTNTGLFTRSHCDCDGKFYKCLKEADNIIANSIGYTYFTVLGPQCFKEDYPIIDCVEERKGKCEKYLTDPDGEKSFQWFDNSVF